MMPQHSLPKGWHREERLREGIGRKLVQVIYWSPSGKKCTNKSELMAELGKDWDAPECLDFKTGVYSSEALKKKQEKEKRKNEFYLKHGHAPIDYNFDLPVRRAQWCGDMPLHMVRSFPNNEVRHDVIKPKDSDGDQRPVAPVRQRPAQLLGEKRLEGIQPKDYDDVETGKIGLPKCLKPTCPDVFDSGNLVTRVCSQLMKNGKLPMTGQKDNATISPVSAEDNTLYREIMTQDPVQPLCNQVQVSDADILEQENKVHCAQRELARAMKLYEQQQRERHNGVMMMS